MTAPGIMAETARHAREVAQGERFEFGENWTRFLSRLDERRIRQAERSLQQMLGRERLDGTRFLDLGSGSGLFSLAARRLGAAVHSVDYDPASVACTAELRRRYHPDDADWRVEEGSVLDAGLIDRLGPADIVYSWGVLHHTGDLWRALDLVHRPVADGGRLCIAIYNDTGTQSARWKAIKRLYNRLPGPLRPAFAVTVSAPQEARALARAILTGRPRAYLDSWRRYDEARGMSRWHDIVDWVGGYPYEVARADAIFSFFRARGFTLEWLKTGGGLGCNEFVFRREPRRS